jgi:hypothetical protein
LFEQVFETRGLTVGGESDEDDEGGKSDEVVANDGERPPKRTKMNE